MMNHLLFNGYVHAHLQYCIQVWSPYLKKDIYRMPGESAKKGYVFTKLVKGLKLVLLREIVTSVGRRRIIDD